jgi:hypothetical protein
MAGDRQGATTGAEVRLFADLSASALPVVNATIRSVAHRTATSTVPVGHSWRDVRFILVRHTPSWGTIKYELCWTSLDDQAVHAPVGRQERAVKLRYDVYASRGYCRHPPRATEGPEQAESDLTRQADAGTLCVSGPLSVYARSLAPMTQPWSNQARRRADEAARALRARLKRAARRVNGHRCLRGRRRLLDLGWRLFFFSAR